MSFKVDSNCENQLAQEFITFLNTSKSSYAAVATSKKLLEANGFEYVSEFENWNNLKSNGKYYTTRNQSTLVAFAIGGKYDPLKSGFSIAAAHSDSPCLRIKPVSAKSSCGTLKVGVEAYGGGIWHTWFDRDLGVSGRALVRQEDGSVVSKILEINKPILRIPSLAIHLDHSINESFKFNKEIHLTPILQCESQFSSKTGESISYSQRNHHDAIYVEIAKNIKCDPKDIVDFDLCLADTHPSCLGGPSDEYILSGRLDNLGMSWTCLKAFIEATRNEKALSNDSQTWVFVMFDNEEIGSQTTMGACSNIIEDVITRVSSSISHQPAVTLSLILRNSFLLSCDMAHAIHPNYPEKHEDSHRIFMQKGVVIKENCSHRYASTMESKFIITEIARNHQIPIQNYVVRNDSTCGTTIGPILAAKLGLRCVDIGLPQLAMHSIREMSAVRDLVHGVNLVINFFYDYTKMQKSLVSDDA